MANFAIDKGILKGVQQWAEIGKRRGSSSQLSVRLLSVATL